jgi:GTP-binding protein
MSSPSPFVDHVQIYFTSGKGGDGVVAWRREKHVPKGGPDGGDGGRGGHIILEGDSQLWTLLDLRYRKFIKAQAGANGEGGKRSGRDGKDEVLKVPLGTTAHDAETGDFLGEVTAHGQQLVLVEGGHGGKGNWHFRTASNQVPTYAGPGGQARELVAVLELKVLADVGLVGFPNAGKSTLLSVMSAAKPKIADYPFTTLVPNLGIVKYRDFYSYVMADIPGIIEGAHEGRGLGHTFLRHIERNSILLLLIAADSPNPVGEYKTLINELEAYNPELLDKTRLVTLTKSDLLDAKSLEKLQKKLQKSLKGQEVMTISSVAQTGLEALNDRIWQALHA